MSNWSAVIWGASYLADEAVPAVAGIRDTWALIWVHCVWRRRDRIEGWGVVLYIYERCGCEPENTVHVILFNVGDITYLCPPIHDMAVGCTVQMVVEVRHE